MGFGAGSLIPGATMIQVEHRQPWDEVVDCQLIPVAAKWGTREQAWRSERYAVPRAVWIKGLDGYY